MEVRKEANVMMFMFGELIRATAAPTGAEITDLINQLSTSLPQTWASHPIGGLANSLASAITAPHHVQPLDATTWLNYLADTQPVPINTHWRPLFLEATRNATEQYFADAYRQFDRGNILSATEDLCSAVNCTIIGQAAVQGWPHSDHEDDLNAIVGLAAGRLPSTPYDITSLLESASNDGHTLNSNYAATMGMPYAVRHHYFQENGYTPSMVVSFAKEAVELANKLGGNLI
jgi:hypothetical protein